MEVPRIIRMACRNFWINLAEQQSPQHRHHGNHQQQHDRNDTLSLHLPHHGRVGLCSCVTAKPVCVPSQPPAGGISEQMFRDFELGVGSTRLAFISDSEPYTASPDYPFSTRAFMCEYAAAMSPVSAVALVASPGLSFT
jgi:hypothetical protein